MRYHDTATGVRRYLYPPEQLPVGLFAYTFIVLLSTFALRILAVDAASVPCRQSMNNKAADLGKGPISAARAIWMFRRCYMNRHSQTAFYPSYKVVHISTRIKVQKFLRGVGELFSKSFPTNYLLSCSNASSRSFTSSPPPKPVSAPDAPTTRWQGTIIATGFA